MDVGQPKDYLTGPHLGWWSFCLLGACLTNAKDGLLGGCGAAQMPPRMLGGMLLWVLPSHPPAGVLLGQVPHPRQCTAWRIATLSDVWWTPLVDVLLPLPKPAAGLGLHLDSLRQKRPKQLADGPGIQASCERAGCQESAGGAAANSRFPLASCTVAPASSTTAQPCCVLLLLCRAMPSLTQPPRLARTASSAPMWPSASCESQVWGSEGPALSECIGRPAAARASRLHLLERLGRPVLTAAGSACAHGCLLRATPAARLATACGCPTASS